MRFRFLLSTLLCVQLLLQAISYAQLPTSTPQPDEELTLKTSWETGAIIGREKIYIDRPINVERKFIGITAHGYFIVQDFYLDSGTKLTDPYVLLSRDDAQEFVAHEWLRNEGSFTRWYENGMKWVEWYYRDHKLHGLWTRWYENGQKSEEGLYDHGGKNGLWIKWHENGVKSQEISYSSGVQNGFATEWYDNGKVRTEVVVLSKTDGQMARLEWSREGKIIREIPLPPQNILRQSE